MNLFMPGQETVQIYVYLEGEGTDVWRPVEAVQMDMNKYRIVTTPVDDEVWQFAPGDVVMCRVKKSDNQTILVAYERAVQ